MKLLLDENLSPDLVERLADIFPELACVRGLGLEGAPDGTIWKFAKEHGYTVLTKDADFAERSVFDQTAPKIIWIRLGNCSTNILEMLLRARSESIRLFVMEESPTCLHLGSPLKRRS